MSDLFQSIDKLGIAKVMEMTLDHLSPQNNIHVSFDVDALDPSYAPSTGTAVQNGLTLREGIHIAEALRATNRIQGIDVVELNPNLGSDSDKQQTIEATMSILKAFYGHQRGGCSKNIDESIFKLDNEQQFKMLD